MDTYLYLELLKELAISAEKFSVGKEMSEEIDEDISTIIKVSDIAGWKQNIDGVVKDVPQLLKELAQANESGDREMCINSIAMLRCAISDVASAFSNAMDSMENMVVSIRDKKL